MAYLENLNGNSKLNNSSNRKTRFNIFLGVCIALTNLTQLPIFAQNGFSSNLATFIWFILFAVLLLNILKTGKIMLADNATKEIVFIIYFVVFAALCEIFTEKNYLNTALASAIYISVFIYFVGVLSAKYFNANTVETISTFYILSAAIVAINIFFEYLLGYDITSRFYAYSSKNSISQIIITAVIMIIVFKFNLNTKKPFDKILTIGYILLFIFLVYTLLLLRSRATIIALPFIFISIIWWRKTNRKAATVITIGIVILFIYFIFNPIVFDSFINNIIYAGRGDTLADLTSERDIEWNNFGYDFSISPLIGIGSAKRESLILTALLEYGLVGGVPILLYAIHPLYYGFLKLNLKKAEIQIFILISFTYILNGVFEQLSPFGPGVKCYVVWFLMGVYTTNYMYIKPHKRGYLDSD